MASWQKKAGKLAAKGTRPPSDIMRLVKVAGAAPKPEVQAPFDDLSDVWTRIPQFDSAPVTFRDAVGRWYANAPGGFDGAVDRSQDALRTLGDVYPDRSMWSAYGPWDASDVDRPVDVRYGNLEPQVEGAYNPLGIIEGEWGDPVIEMRQRILAQVKIYEALRRAAQRTPYQDDTLRQLRDRRNAALEHELTHGLTDRRRASPLLRLLARDMHFDSDVDHGVYKMTRVELDPRIAEVRRRYAYHTGNDVATPKDAATAWQWYGDNRKMLVDPKRTPEIASYLAAGKSPAAEVLSDYDFYNQLPKKSKQIIFRRMTQVPAVMGAAAAAGSGEQKQPRLLDGLRTN